MITTPTNYPPAMMYKDLMKFDEDWTRLENSAERRRLQNRIAQRAYRRNMRERTNEVERLKTKIRELRNATREGTRFDTSLDVSPSRSHYAIETYGLGREVDQQDRSGRETKMRGHTPTSEQEVMTAVQQSSAFGKLPDLASCTDQTLATSRISKPQIVSAPVRSLPVCSVGSSPDQFQNDSHTGMITPSLAPSPGGHIALRASNTSAVGSVNNGKFPVDDAAQYVNHTQPVTTSMDESNTLQWSSIESTHTQDPSLIQNPSPLSLDLDYNEFGTSPSQGSLLHLAIASGNPDTLRLLLLNLKIPTTTRDADGYTPLERAVLYGRTDLVAILIHHGFHN